MPEQATDAADRARPPSAHARDEHAPIFSGFGIASAVLGLVAVAAVVLGALIWSDHRAEQAELRHRAAVLQTAADWAAVLVNMNADNVADSLRRLHEGTVGELNTDFEAVLQPYEQLVRKLQTRSRGQIDSVSIEILHRDLPPPDADGATAPRPRRPDDELSGLASRTDTVLVVATSVSENAAGGEPQTVRWKLRLGVSEVDGRLLISRLETLR